MNIDAYILDLLNSHDCVIIPEFGGFIKNYVSAEISEKDKSFRSPHNEILFNNKLKKNDGLLINYISEKNNISYKSAELELNKYKSELKNTINNSGSANITGIGEFYYDGSNLAFSSKTEDYFSDAYGLSDFYFPELESYEQDIAVSTKAGEYKSTVSRKLSTINFKRAALLLPVFIVFLLLPNKVRMKQEVDNNAGLGLTDVSMEDSMENIIHSMTSKKNALFYTEPEKNENLIADEDLQIEKIRAEEKNVRAEKKSEKEITEKTKDKKIEKKEVKNNKTEKPFQLIAGSFASKYRAELFIKSLKIKNVNAFVLNKQNGRFRVSLGSFDKRPSAEIALSNMRDTSDLKVWLLAR